MLVIPPFKFLHQGLKLLILEVKILQNPFLLDFHLKVWQSHENTQAALKNTFNLRISVIILALQQTLTIIRIRIRILFLFLLTIIILQSKN